MTKELIELSEEQLDIELKTAVFIDDLKIICEKYKLPENIIESRFLSNKDLPKRIARAIFINQPLSKSFLVKNVDSYDSHLLTTNPRISKET